MYRVMIVDDEPLILAGIASVLNWEELDCRIVGKATNGQQALNQIEALQPDIIITDIKMPVMDGIELFREAKEQGCMAAFVFLTNLEEFKLVKKAISLGAIDYLVKLELTSEMLEASMRKAIESCEKNEKLKAMHDHREGMELTSDEMIGNYFRSLLIHESGIIKPETIPADIAVKFRNPVVVMVNFNYNFTDFSEEFTREDQKKVMSFAYNILTEMVKHFFENNCLVRWEQNSFIIIVSTYKAEFYRQSVVSLGEKVRLVIKDYFESSVSIAVSNRGESLEEFPELVYQAMSGMNYYYYDSSDPIVFYSKKCEISQQRTSNFNIGFLKKDLTQAVKRNDRERFREIMEELISILEENKPSKLQAINACSNLYYFLTSFFEEEEAAQFPYSVNILSDLNQFGSLHNIIEWLRWFSKDVAKLVDRQKGSKSDRIIEMVRKYVMEHYREKITLSDVAESLNLSHGYLSSVFKKQTGNNFSDYVSEIKIEKAKELIVTHKYMIYEVSDILGFDNPYYFSKVFKKVTGYTPKEYGYRK